MVRDTWKEWVSWRNMRRRCSDKKDKAYERYGGRGITVCNRWKNSFNLFLKDMGKCPSGFSIERKNNDGNYSPTNCIWASPFVQSRNIKIGKYEEGGQLNEFHIYCP